MPQAGAAVAAWYAGASAATVIAVGAAVVAAGMSIYAIREAKKMAGKSSSASAQKQMFRSAVAPKQLLLGHPITSGPMFMVGETGEPNDKGEGEWLHICVHLAGHPCDSVTNAWLNDEELLPMAAPAGVEQAYSHPNGLGFVYIYLGENRTSAPVTLAGLDDWRPGMIGKGQCFAHIKLKSDPQKWPAGLPNPKFAIKGLKVEDPRTGRTAWSDNPALLMRWYRTALKQGVPVDESYIQAANICDENAFLPGTANAPAEKRYRCSYAFPCNESPRNVISKIKATCAGTCLRVAGRHAMQVGAYYGPGTVALSESDIIGDLTITPDVRRRDRINTVTAKYLDPDENWNEVDMPRVRHDGYLAEDNGTEVVEDLDLQCCPSPWQAQRVAWIYLNTTRRGIRIDIPCNLRGVQLLPGCVFRLNFPENQWHGLELQVEKWKLGHQNGVTLQCKQHIADNYTWNADTAVAPTRPGAPSLIDPTRVAMPSRLAYQEVPDSNTVQALISWQHQSFGNITYEVGFYRGGKYLRGEETTDKHVRLVDGFAVGTYEVRVVARNGFGATSEAASLVFSVRPPARPVNCLVDAGNWAVSMKPVPAALTNYDTQFDFAWDFPAGSTPEEIDLYVVGRARHLSVQNLAPNTEYQYAVREVSRWGASGWYQGVAKTLLKGDDVLDVISGQIDREHMTQEVKVLVDQLDRNIPGSLPDKIDTNLASQQRINTEYDLVMAEAVGDLAGFRTDYERRVALNERLIDASVYIDPDKGTIVNRAWAYTDTAFSNAMVALDGVKGAVSIQSGRISETEAGIKANKAAINVAYDKIELRATYSEVDASVSKAIEAITPAYYWTFYTGKDGWQALTGSLSHSGNESLIASPGHVSVDNIAFNGSDNPLFKLRLKRLSGTGWQGKLRWLIAGTWYESTMNKPEGADFTVLSVNQQQADSWRGDIAAIELLLGIDTNDRFELDYINIGKYGALDTEMDTLRGRVTTVETELDPENARWAAFVSHEYWQNNALTQSDVRQEINGWDSQWKVTASLKEYNDNDVLGKATTAWNWVNAAEGNIEQGVQRVLNAEGGVNEQLGESVSQITQASQRIDVVEKSITQQITDANSLDREQSELMLELIGQGSSLATLRKEAAKHGGKLALANETLSAQADELKAQASKQTELVAVTEEHASQINEVSKALSTEKQSTASKLSRLQAGMGEGDEQVLAQAQDYTRASIGFCVDKDGNITSEENAVACTAAGHSWVEAPLAEVLRKVQITTADGKTATVTDLMQTFENQDGRLVARGGFLLDVDGRVTGIAAVADGKQTMIDLVGDGVAISAPVTKKKLFFLDTAAGEMVLRGRLELSDGTKLSKAQDIQGNVYEHRFIISATQPPAPKGTNPASWTVNPPVRQFGQVVWHSLGQKTAAGALVGIWSTPVRWSGDKGDTVKGEDGTPGAGMYPVATQTGVFPDDSTALALFEGHVGRKPVRDDHMTIYKASDVTVATTKRFDGAGWVAPLLVLHGDMLAEGTVTADRMVANAEIEAPHVKGGLVEGGTVRGAVVEGVSVRGSTITGSAIQASYIAADVSMLTLSWANQEQYGSMSVAYLEGRGIKPYMGANQGVVSNVAGWGWVRGTISSYDHANKNNHIRYTRRYITPEFRSGEWESGEYDVWGGLSFSRPDADMGVNVTLRYQTGGSVRSVDFGTMYHNQSKVVAGMTARLKGRLTYRQYYKPVAGQPQRYIGCRTYYSVVITTAGTSINFYGGYAGLSCMVLLGGTDRSTTLIDQAHNATTPVNGGPN